MSAKNYEIAVAGLSGKVYIAKKMKQRGIMGSDRVVVSDNEFINAIIEFTKHRIEDGAGTMQIMEGDKIIAEIRIIN